MSPLNPYWRSLDTAAGRQGTAAAPDPPEQESRREFFRLMAASMALAGVTGCTRQPTELIYPYVQPPEQLVPGRPLFFATALSSSGLAQGVLVESHEGRPTKVEGNPDHPASLGATDVLSQAAVLDLYDPDRLKSIRGPNGAATWGEFQIAARRLMTTAAKDGGARVRVLTRTVVSPTLGSQLNDLRTRFPNARWVQYDATGPHSARSGAQAAFGAPVNTWYRLDAAQVVVALDSDFLACGPTATRYAHDFMTRRRVRGSDTAMNRLYSIESTLTSTGGKADHRWAVRPSQVEIFAEELAGGLGVSGFGAGSLAAAKTITDDLQLHRGASVVIPGETTSSRVHAIAHAINAALGAPVVYTSPVEVEPVDQIAALRLLTEEMNGGAVDVLVIIGANPVYDAPADIDFAAALHKVRHRICLGTQSHETADLCTWLLPETHTLEAWSDTRAFDGTVTIQQPLIAPLYDSHSAHELVAVLMGEPLPSYEAVRQYWRTRNAAPDFEDWWRKSVHDGVVAGSALPAITAATMRALPPRAQRDHTGIELDIRPDPYLVDGSSANNSWLQELPRPMTKLTWDNAAHVSPRTAGKLALRTGEVIQLEQRGSKVETPVFVTAGQADDCITVHLGYGRTKAGRIGSRVGFNAGRLRFTDALWSGGLEKLQKTGREHPLASTQLHHSMEGRDIVIAEPVGVYAQNPDFVQLRAGGPAKRLTLYKEWDYTGYAWGMAIDQTACVNCNACVIACQAENNIPVVGKDQVLAQRQMHWLRVDTYFSGPAENPSAHYQPVPCMHCEQAPCELVCPTQATNHSRDGLNDMVYNRCVGTRYCSNNCPYKVRRFNFFLYADWNTESLKLQRNPDVTVRSRGVMEKCTYCVQRIREAEIAARTGNRSIRDGEVVPACAQVCPTQAIVFGNINDRQSHVARLKAEKLNYGLLAELNTRPRTTYLAELRNPNPEIKA